MSVFDLIFGISEFRTANECVCFDYACTNHHISHVCLDYACTNHNISHNLIAAVQFSLIPKFRNSEIPKIKSNRLTMNWKSLITLITWVWLLTSMFIHVFFQITMHWKGFITLVTLTWLLIKVFIHMYFQIIIYWKSFITLGTLIWARDVSLHVVFQFWFCSFHCCVS